MPRWLLVWGLTLLPLPVLAVPTLQRIEPPALQVGATTTVTLVGTELLPDTQLVLPLVGVTQAVKPGATANRMQIDVTLPTTAPVGYAFARLAHARGISNAVPIAVDHLPTRAVDSPADVNPVAWFGTLAGNGTLRGQFPGKKGQTIRVEVDAKRLGSTLDPVVTLYHPRGVQLAYATGVPARGGDALLTATLPDDGLYTVEVHDLLFQAGAGAFARVRAGAFQAADYAWPMGVNRAAPKPVELRGTLTAPQQANVALVAGLNERAVTLPNAGPWAGSAPQVFVSDYPELAQTPGAQTLPTPSAVTGHLTAAEDRYQVQVTPGQKLRIELFAQRIGSAFDGVITVYSAPGQAVATNDDQPNSADPVVEYTVPAKVEQLLVGVADSGQRTGLNAVYRLALTPARPDFALTLLTDTANVPANGTAIVRVRAQRAGYNGPIAISVPQLPSGVTMEPVSIAPSTTDALLTFKATNDAKPGFVLTQIVGTATIDRQPVNRAARLADAPTTKFVPNQRSDFAVAAVPALGVQITLPTPPTVLPAGTQLAVPVQITRRPNQAGPVRLSVQTSQVIPRNPQTRQEDAAKAIRVEGDPNVPAGKDTHTLLLAVPADVPLVGYDVAVQAEWLSADGKTVLERAATAALRVPTVLAFSVNVAGPITLMPGAKEPTKLTGTVTRLGEFKQPLTLTLTDLPAGVPAPKPVTVAANATMFEFVLTAPAGTKPAITTAKVQATSVPPAKQMSLVGKPAEVSVSVK